MSHTISEVDIHLVVPDARSPSPVGMAPALVPDECQHLEHHTETHHHTAAAHGLVIILALGFFLCAPVV